MRVLVMFDLPTLTSGDLREYRRFRKFLITSGFIMLQESVYCKLVQNSSVASTVTDNVRKNKPPEGLVQVLSVTERQYAKMGANLLIMIIIQKKRNVHVMQKNLLHLLKI